MPYPQRTAIDAVESRRGLMKVKSDPAGVRHREDMPSLLLIARVLFASVFLLAAPRHFTAEAAAHAADLGVPLARFAVPLSGVLALLGGIGVALGLQTRWSAALLIAFLIPVTFGMHAFWRIDDPAAFAVQRGMFVKNIAMISGAIYIACAGAGALSVDAWLGGRG
jgi:putative oxidoreductase